MSINIEKHVDVQAPVGDTYASWWRSFEAADLGPDVKSVEPTGPQRYRWHASVAGVGEEWIAEVTERIPGRRIAWTSREGASHAGCVSFHRLGPERTRVMLQLEVEPEGWLETLGAWLGVLDRRVDAALDDFKIGLEEEQAGLEEERASEESEPRRRSA